MSMLRTGRSHAGIGSAMDSRGEQIITSAKTEAKERRDRLLVAAFVLGVGLLCYFMQDSPPKKPPAPPSQQASFVSTQPGKEPLVVRIAGGVYDISYHTVDEHDQLVQDLDPTTTFVADFSHDTFRGNINTAQNILVIGTVNLAVAAIGGADRFHADILSHGKSIDADFRYANSARGPPGSAPVRKKIFIVGEMRAISLPESFQNSESDTHALDLDPSPQALAEYRDALSRYEASRQAYDLAQQQGQERKQAQDADKDKGSDTSHPAPEFK
jgi:hypothetical protein